MTLTNQYMRVLDKGNDIEHDVKSMTDEIAKDKVTGFSL